MKNEIGFIEFYVKYQKLRTDADPVFARTAALVLLGNAIGKNWVNRLQPDRIYHNIYATLIGDSTTSRKTTSLDIAKEIYPENNRLPEEYSPESYIANLGIKPQSITFIDEFSMFLKGATNRNNYMSRILEIWCTLHKYKTATYTRALQSNTYTVENPYPSILAAGVPNLLYDNVTKEMLLGGPLARFLLVHGESNPKPRGRLPVVADALEKHFIEIIEFIIRECRYSNIEFRLTEDALSYFHTIEQELYKKYDDILPFVGRYLEYLVSIADLMKLSDLLYKGSGLTELTNLTNLTNLTELTGKVVSNLNNLIKPLKIVKKVNLVKINDMPKEPLEVEKNYVEKSFEFIRPCLDYAKRLQDYICESRPVAAFREYLLKYAPSPHSKAMQRTHLDAKQMRAAVETLGEGEQEIIFELLIPREGRGSPKKIYCLFNNIGSKRCNECKWKERCELKWRKFYTKEV